MKYILVEFMALFMIDFYRTLSSVTIVKDQIYSINHSIITGFLLFIFSQISEGKSQGLFNPTMAITQNTWQKLEGKKTIGYLGAHFIAGFTAVSLIVWLVPYDGLLNVKNYYLGVKQIEPTIDNMSVCLIEMMGIFILYMGYIYYTEVEPNPLKRSIYYGAFAVILDIAFRQLTDGAFNVAMLIGGITIDGIATSNYVALFVGGLLGSQLARLVAY